MHLIWSNFVKKVPVNSYIYWTLVGKIQNHNGCPKKLVKYLQYTVKPPIRNTPKRNKPPIRNTFAADRIFY